MRKVMIFVGTRPDAIKLAPVIDVLRDSGRFNVLVCSTGQHEQLLQQVLDFFSIRVDFRLDVMEPDQQLAALTARLLTRIDELLACEQPDCVMVQGDTTTTFAASLAAFYNKVPILHVEAGLRTFDKFSPFPEEMNRVSTTRLADFHYAPTEQSRRNLQAEGVRPDRILVTGNTVIDALFLGLERLGHRTPAGITALRLDEVEDFILVTMHRRENHGEGIRSICTALKRIADDAGVPVIVPVHLNPNVRDDVHELLGHHPLIHLASPVPYAEFLWLLKNSRLILTDSGGVQEEAPSLGKPVLLLRETTERPEAIEAGTVLSVGSDANVIYSEAMRLLTDRAATDAMSTKSNPYGDGQAARRIVESMLTLAEDRVWYQSRRTTPAVPASAPIPT